MSILNGGIIDVVGDKQGVGGSGYWREGGWAGGGGYLSSNKRDKKRDSVGAFWCTTFIGGWPEEQEVTAKWKAEQWAAVAEAYRCGRGAAVRRYASSCSRAS
jgi:hypothetical protein